MNSFQIIYNNMSIEELYSFNENDFGTYSESEKSISKKNKSLLIRVIAGIITLAPATQTLNASNIVEIPSHSFEACMTNYIESVNIPFADFIFNIDNLTRPYKFSKDDIVKDIISFRCLNAKWDGYSALPLEVESASNALKFIDHIGDNIFRNLDDVYPNTNGTISFHWRNDSNEEISLEMGNDVCSYYVALNSQKPLFFNEIEINAFEAEGFAKHLQVL